MIHWNRYILVAVWLAGGVSLSAETVVLTNGDRIEGQIVQRSAEEVSIRRLSEDGRIRFVQKIRRSSIHAIEEGEAPDLTPRVESRPEDGTASHAATRSAATRPAHTRTKAKPSTIGVADRQDLLKAAIEKWNKQEYGSVGFQLTRLINNLSEQDLTEMSAQVEKALDMSLGDFAAEAHFRAAVDLRQDRAGNLQYVTGYEKPYLIPRLVDAYQQAVAEEVGVPAKAVLHSKRPSGRAAESRPAETQPARTEHRATTQPAGTRPAGGTQSPRTVAAWLDRPDEFDLPREEARPFARQIIVAAKLISEIVRLDPEAQTNRNRLEELTRTRRKLYALYHVAIARAGGALTPEEREAQQASIEEQQEKLRKVVELNQKRQQEIMDKAIQAARERGEVLRDPRVELRSQPTLPGKLPAPVNTDDISAIEHILKSNQQELKREK